MNKVKSFFTDFKKFITRGNILDMAVGVIVGGAFNSIVNALTNKILMPLITMAVPGGLNGLVTVLNPWEATLTKNATGAWVDGSGNVIANTIEYYGHTYNADVVNVINWGAFINAVIDFFVIAFVMFLIVRSAMKLQAYTEHAKDIAKAYTIEEREELRKQGKSERQINKMAEKKLKDNAEAVAKAKEEEKAKAEAAAKAREEEPVQLLRDIKALLEEKK